MARTILGTLERAAGLHVHRVVLEDITGPDSDITIDPGASVQLEFPIAQWTSRKVVRGGVASIGGLPADIVVTDLSVDEVNKKVVMTVKNVGTASVTISANSIGLKVLYVA